LRANPDDARRRKAVLWLCEDAVVEFSLNGEQRARAQEDILRLVQWTAILALGFLGISSVIGAVPMMLYPNGSPWQMPQSLLDSSPFESFLIPGIVLFIANGVLSLASLIGVIRRDPGYARWVVLQGAVLAAWLVIEIAMIRQVVTVHYIYGGLAVVMIISGLVLNRAASRSTRAQQAA
jgi:hypothetical protein